MVRYLLLLISFTALQATAQVRLTLQDAMERTLHYNFDIKAASASAQQAAANNTLGNAGFAPIIMGNAGVSGSNYNTHNQLTSGGIQENPAAIGTGGLANVAGTWTLFDGGKMFVLKKQLNELEKLGDVQYRYQVQAMVSRTIQMYAQCVFQQRQLIAIDTALALAKVRMDISNVKYQSGAGAKIDYLQARVDYNARQSDSLTYETTLTQAFDSLSVLMGENEDNYYKVDDSLDLDTTLEPVDKDRLTQINLSIDVFRRNAKVSKLNEDIAKTYFLPYLTATGGYYYTHATSASGFSSLSRSYGPSGALNISVPIFEGGNLRRQVKVASLQAMRDELIYEKQNTVIGRAYRTAWKDYEVSVAAYKLEIDNIKYAKENLDVQLARFKVGIGTTLESRQAENDYVTALVRVYTAELNLKVNETIVLSWRMSS